MSDDLNEQGRSERDTLIAEVHAAFAGVTRGDQAISWNECYALDNYETDAVCNAARRSDRDGQWTELIDDPEWDPFPGVGGFSFINAEGFRYYRDDLPSSKGPINDQRDRFESIFETLKGAEIKRRNLYLAWDFTVASNENVAKNILAMRDDAFADLGDTHLGDGAVQGNAPSFQVTSVQNYEPTDTSPLPEDADMARRVQGTFTVPCYMTDPDGPGGEPPCSPGSRLNLDSSGVPEQNGTWTANFNCMIPYAALNDPARPTIYGHGLLGSASCSARTSPRPMHSSPRRPCPAARLRCS